MLTFCPVSVKGTPIITIHFAEWEPDEVSTYTQLNLPTTVSERKISGSASSICMPVMSWHVDGIFSVAVELAYLSKGFAVVEGGLHLKKML